MSIKETATTVIDKTEDTVRKQIKGFIKESGKRTALILSVMSSLIVSGTFIPQEYVTSFLVAVLLIGMGVSFLVIYSFASKDTKQMKNEFKNMGYKLVQIDMTTRGKIENLERFTDDVIFEINYETQLIQHANANFTRVLGWTAGEVNNLKSMECTMCPIQPQCTTSEECQNQSWIQWFTYTCVHPDDRDRFREEMMNIDHLKATARYKCWIKRKNGMFFPSTMTINFIHEPDLKVLHCFLSDEQDEQDLLRTINAQNTLIRLFEQAIARKSDDTTEIRNLVKMIKDSF